MQFMKSVDLIGYCKFLPWRQLDGCSGHFLSVKGVACKTRLTISIQYQYVKSNSERSNT